MAVTISTPSWREDQPWAIEQGLANTLGARSPNLAETMLTRYGLERQANQGAYHDYMRAINALQAQNMADARAEAGGKLSVSMVENAGKYQGAGDAFRSNPVTAPFYQGDTSALDQGAIDNARAKQTHDLGIGFQGYGSAGTDPDSLAALANSNPATQGMRFTVPSNVQAQAEANKGRFAQAAATAGKAGALNYSTAITQPSADRAGINVHGSALPGETPEQTQKRFESLQQVPLRSQLRDAPQLPLAQVDATQAPMEVTPGGSTPAGPRGVGPTADQADKAVSFKIAEWLSRGDPAHKQMAHDAVEYSVDQGQGGKPIVRLQNGRIYVLGKGGQAYQVQ